jgi:hypothetical protein
MTRSARVAAFFLVIVSVPVHAQTLAIGPRLATIELNGSVEDVFVDARGNVVSRSFMFGGIVHDATGRSVAQVPGASWGIGLGGEGRILVARSEPIANFSLETLVLDSGELRSEGSVRLRFQPRDLCSLGPRRFALTAMLGADGRHARVLIHEVDPAGAIVRSFGTREKAEGPLREIVGDRDDFHNDMSLLVCDERTETLYFVSKPFGVVRAFTADGVERWRAQLEDFEPMKIEPSSNGCCRYGGPANPLGGPVDEVRGLAIDEGGRLLVGLQRTEFRRATRTATSYALRVLDAATGTEIARQPTEGAVVAITADRVYLYQQRLDDRLTSQVAVHSLPN